MRFFHITAALVACAAATLHAAPGLVGEFTDGESSVHAISPTPNFTLAANESVHSQIAPAFKAVWRGKLLIEQVGEYNLSGDAEIKVDGAPANDKPLKLAAGEHDLLVAYTRKPGAARLQLRWKSDFFIEEPIPPDAFAHADAIDELTRQWNEIEHGRAQYENLGCVKCHGGDAWKLASPPVPDLSDIGQRVTTDWLHTWLKTPRHYRSTSLMPRVLNTDEDVQHVAAYLKSLGGESAASPSSNPVETRIETGKEIFDTIGCNKCHGEKGHSLAGVGAKYQTVAALTRFIADPLHIDPSGRMPQLFDPQRQVSEAALVAEYLFHRNKETKGWSKLPAEGDIDRGRTLVQSQGCVACHTVRENEKPLASTLKSPEFATAKFNAEKGCLAVAPPKDAPDYQLSEADRNGLRAFLKSMQSQPVVARAPVDEFYRRVKQYNCTACHSLNEHDAGPDKIIDDEGLVVKLEHPPTLTGAGDKLRVDWIDRVLVQQKRTRPWMKLRMPHFGDAMKPLPPLFPAASGAPSVDPAPQPDIALAKAGLETIGEQRGKVSCITCHSYRGNNRQKEGVVPAPDMAEIGQTLRADWFNRWLHNPPRMAPGTSMPQFFLELDGPTRRRNIDQLWAALVHQEKLPLPKGLEGNPTEGTKVIVGNEPVVFRVATKTPVGQIDRAINVGLPIGRHFTFDAATAQLKFAWKGEFINAAPAWNGRGGNPVNAQGESLYQAPGHFELRVGDATAEPNVRFLGYSIVDTIPVFRYTVDKVEIHEQIDISESEIIRRFAVAATDRPLFFVGDEKRKYSSPAGDMLKNILRVEPGKDLVIEVRTPIAGQ